MFMQPIEINFTYIHLQNICRHIDPKRYYFFFYTKEEKIKRQFKCYNPHSLYVEQFFSILAEEISDVLASQIYFYDYFVKILLPVSKIFPTVRDPMDYPTSASFIFLPKEFTINNHLHLFLLFPAETFVYLIDQRFLYYVVVLMTFKI